MGFLAVLTVLNVDLSLESQMFYSFISILNFFKHSDLSEQIAVLAIVLYLFPVK